MSYFNVYLNSSVANIAASLPYSKIAEIREQARKAVVSLEFQEDYCRIVGAYNRKIKVPKKATSSPEGFTKWIEERIEAAWK